MRLDQQQLLRIILLMRVLLHVAHECHGNGVRQRGLIVQLEADDAAIQRGGICHEISEIAVQRHKQRVESLRRLKHNRITAFNGDVVLRRSTSCPASASALMIVADTQ